MNNNIQIRNKNGEVNSLQISVLNNVPAGNTDFKRPVLIKNITEENITVEVKLNNDDKFISTVLYPGWNVEIIKAINNVTENQLQYGW